MPYNIIDLIDKALEISNNVLNLYLEVNKKQENMNSLKVFSNVFIGQEKQKIKYYEKLKEELIEDDLKDIEFFVYDKISSLMLQFNSKIVCGSVHNSKKLIECVLNMDENIRALFLDVRGRLIQKQGDGDSYEYEVLTGVIEMQEKYIKDLRQLYRI